MRKNKTDKERFFIIAGNLTDERWRLKPVIGVVLSLVFDFQIGTIPVPNMEATIAYVMNRGD